MQHSYKDYLAQQYLKENMDVVVAKNVREAVGSVEDIYKRNTDRITSGLTDIQCRIDRTNDNLEEISFGLDGIQGTLDVINGNIVSGFQALFVQAEELNDSLAHIGRCIDELNRGVDELIEIGRTPVQIWAYNHYEIARDAARRRLFPEALEAVNFAISGNSQHTGLKTDYRFHHLRGVLLLGIPGEPHSADLVDLKAAENSFLLAARYAHHDNLVEEAQALVGAGKAAYAEGRLGDAQEHYIASLKADPKCGEANYQMARLFVHANDERGIEHYLSSAFNVHWSFAMRAAEDAQFSDITDLVEKCVRSTTARIVKEIQPPMQTIVDDLKFLKEREIRLCPIVDFGEHSVLLDDIAKAKDAMNQRRLKDVFDIRNRTPRTSETLRKLAESYCVRLRSSEGSISAQGVAPSIPSAPRLDSEKIATRVTSIICGAVAIVAIFAFFAAAKGDLARVKGPVDLVVILIFLGIFLGIPLAIVFGGAGAIIGRISFFVAHSVAKGSNEASERRERSRNEVIGKKNRAIVERNRAIVHQMINEIQAHFGGAATPAHASREISVLTARR